MTKLILIFCSILLLASSSRAANEIIRNHNGAFSAHLNNAKLSELTKSITDSYEVEFKGPDELFQSAVSGSFENLKLEEMVKRILGGKNYVFKYDKQGKLTEVTLLPKSQNDTKARSANAAATPRPPAAAVQPLPLPTPQATNPAASGLPGPPPVKADPVSGEGQTTNLPSPPPEVPVPVSDQ